ncbi:CRISPR-associated protein Cas5 [Clostridiales Family XIII bacterium ASD5510]|uniref:CRISPR-associated protein Cas5 n=1 Tax=Hominibacterium faecale TaxID=2839743 RepID=A0A9J6QRR0_9FIRM|nr:CRISPR-associated protein Cas5 [Hominibacterium faecale]MCU7378108.1 CRISPR-associated protein Cas5 [Hominibacterium faecale]
MKTLRLILTQSQAHYRRPETVDNCMTYPLPPFSTVIGAIHKACGYREYHPMDLSVQGDYGAMKQEMFRSMTVLNRVEMDRGTLVWMPENMLSNAHIKIGKAITRGADFRTRQNVRIYNVDEYHKWLALRSNLQQAAKETKSAEEELKAFRKEQEAAGKKRKDYRDSDQFLELRRVIKEAKQKKAALQAQMEQYHTVEYIPTYQEILFDVKLIIHLQADDVLLQDIYTHRYDIQAIGRSEDFINLESADFIELDQTDKSTVGQHHAYIKDIDDFKFEDGRPLMGTRYLLPKNYTIIDGKRNFKDVGAMWVSNYKIKKFSDSIWHDPDGYIVNFV